MQFIVMTTKWRFFAFLYHYTAVGLAQLVQPVLAEQHIQ